MSPAHRTQHRTQHCAQPTPRRRRVLPAALLAASLTALPATFGAALITAAPAIANEAFTLTRLTPDTDRFETAAAIARLAFPGGVGLGQVNGRRAAILVNGDDPVDALAAASVAGTRLPILYTHRDSVPTITLSVLDELGIQSVLLAGGQATISDVAAVSVRTEQRLPYRFGGADRYETAAQWASMVPPRPIPEPEQTPHAVLVAGDRLADALFAAPYAAAHGIPLLLTERDRLPAATATALRRVLDQDRLRDDPQVQDRLVVVGGEAAVSEAVLDQVDAVAATPTATNAVAEPIQWFRWAGPDRYSTAVQVADASRWGASAPATVGLANGERLVDALPGSVLLAQRGAPVLLLRDGALSETTSGWLRTWQGGLTSAIALGSIAEPVAVEVRQNATAPQLTGRVVGASASGITVRLPQRSDYRYTVALAPARPGRTPQNGGTGDAFGYAPAPVAPPANARILAFRADPPGALDGDGVPSGSDLMSITGLTADTRYDVWISRSVAGLPAQTITTTAVTSRPAPQIAGVRADTDAVHISLTQPVQARYLQVAVAPASSAAGSAQSGYSPPAQAVGGDFFVSPSYISTVDARVAPIGEYTIAGLAAGSGYEVFVRTDTLQRRAEEDLGGRSAWSYWNSDLTSAQPEPGPRPSAPSIVTPTG